MHDWRRVLIIAICALLFLLVITAKQNRRHVALTDRKQCRNCGARFVAEAKFCGRCGRAF